MDDQQLLGQSLDESQAKGTRILSVYLSDGRVEVFVHRSFASKCDAPLLIQLQDHMDTAIKRVAAQEGNKI